MTSHQLAIAKAAFSAALFRPDPIAITKDEIAHLHSLLNTVSIECSPAHVQKCKNWVVSNIIQSAARSTAFGKYLIALCTSYTPTISNTESTNTAKREPSSRRKRLHLLYLLNDVLYHAQVHSNDASVSSKFQPSLVQLFSSAALFKDAPKHHRKIQDLLEIWRQRSYYSDDYIEKLHEAVRIASLGAPEKGEDEENGGSGTTSKKNTPYTMPAMHGDQNLPWYDLPASNLMPHITPNSTRAINPSMIRPLRFVAGPADKNLINAVQDFLKDVDKIYGETSLAEVTVEPSWDIDEMGQLVLQDQLEDEELTGEGYYGWSKQFCDRMKRRKKGETPGETGGSPRRSRSSSRSSYLGRKRRYSSDSDSDRSRSRDRRNTRAKTSTSRSRSPPRRFQDNAAGNRRSDQEHIGTPLTSSHGAQGHQQGYLGQTSGSLPYVPPNIQFPSGMVEIPPPPPHFQGPWPPPPPPPQIPHDLQGHVQGQTLGFGQWPPPPPPPPYLQGAPPNWQPQISGQYGQQPLGQAPAPPQGSGQWAMQGNGGQYQQQNQQQWQPPDSFRGGYGNQGRGGGYGQNYQGNRGGSNSNYRGRAGGARGRGW